LDMVPQGGKEQLWGQPDGKKPPAKFMGKWVGITMYLSQMGLEGVANIHLLLDRGR